MFSAALSKSLLALAWGEGTFHSEFNRNGMECVNVIVKCSSDSVAGGAGTKF